MQIPKQMYGKFADVNVRARKIAHAVAGGATVAAAVGELLDIDSVSGLIVVDGPSPLVIGEHFQCFAMLRSISGAGVTSGSPQWELIFRQLLTSAWGVVSLVSQIGTGGLVVGGEARQRPFLEAVARSWDELASSTRYCGGDGNPVRFEKAALSAILSSLTRLGAQVPTEIVNRFDDRWMDSIHDRILAALAGKPYEDSNGH